MSTLTPKTAKPTEYRQGFVEFLGCRIDLSKRPFIPRPETEYWVGKAIKAIKQKAKSKKSKIECLDIFAGSGCIGLALLKAGPDLVERVDFAEKEKKFLEQIKINVKINNIDPKRYRLVQSDISPKVHRKYDYILANPPYVAESRMKEVDPDVLLWEPKGALFAGKDGLDVIRQFLPAAIFHLKKGGEVWMEFDPFQKSEIDKIVRAAEYRHHNFFRDQYGQWRFLRAKA